MATVSDFAQLQAAITALDPDIVIAQNINVTSTLNINYATKLSASADISLFWTGASAARRNMLEIGASGNLTIESLILDCGGRDGTLVYVEGGSFTMESGSILRNIVSTMANHAVQIGSTSSAGYTGVFNMNDGLISNINSSETVVCYSGDMIMSNNAAIDNNNASGISLLKMTANPTRPTLTMLLQSRITNNTYNYGPGGGTCMYADVVLGRNEGDSPIISNNTSTNAYFGGLYVCYSSTLDMGFDAQISQNSGFLLGGGLGVAYDSSVVMHGNASILGNTTSGNGAGLIMADSTLEMRDMSHITGNISQGLGGGLYVQGLTEALISGSSVINENSAVNGGGIYITTSTLDVPSVSVGDGNSSPTINQNTATSNGGGVYISQNSILSLKGHSKLENNVATLGKGVFKLGDLELSESLQIIDGLYFDRFDDEVLDVGTADKDKSYKILAVDGAGLLATEIEVNVPSGFFNHTIKSHDPDTSTMADDPAYTRNVPKIIGTLLDDAIVQLETSPHVTSSNVPLVIADKADSYAQLVESDRAAFVIPESFGSGYEVILNEQLNQVLITFGSYTITYNNLAGATHENPLSYTISDLPIQLLNPTKRVGYVFVGWRDSNGQMISEIPQGTTNNIVLEAVWDSLNISFDGNAENATNVPKPIRALQEKMIIPAAIPRRECFRFIGWNVPTSGDGKIYFPLDTINITDASVTLVAQWQPC